MFVISIKRFCGGLIMSAQENMYLAIDLKSFYASVECVERHLNPLTTYLVVADQGRSDKTICLAVSPALKACGIPGRPRLFEVLQQIKKINGARKNRLVGKKFIGQSYDAEEIKKNSDLAIDFIVARPRMELYMNYSIEVYNIYLKYISPEDIHVYSIDEVFIDVTKYLPLYRIAAQDLAVKILNEVMQVTGITATAGIGPNLYLCKVAMDIVAKRIPASRYGVRIAELDEMSYRRMLWAHRPLTDFWRVGKGYAQKLEAVGLYTMGDIARCSLGKADDYYNEELLYRMFGVNAELLIDHAWGWEPCRMKDIKAYHPKAHSIGAGQVLQSPYNFEKARLIVKEMVDLLALELVDKGFVTDQVVLRVSYAVENMRHSAIYEKYNGAMKIDHYGRRVPKHARGTAKLLSKTASSMQMMNAVLALYDRIVNRDLLIRRVTLFAGNISNIMNTCVEEQLDMFTDYTLKNKQNEALYKEHCIQETMLKIKRKFGKNSILKGMNLEEGATTIERNQQIGGHRA